MGMQVERQSADQVRNVVREFCQKRGFDQTAKSLEGDTFIRDDVLQEINDQIKAGEETPRAIFMTLNEEGFWDDHLDGSDDLEEEFVEYYDENHA